MFELGRTYSRSILHEAWGGTKPVQRQGGILTPTEASVVILITGSEGEQYGYDDWRDEQGVWHYFGAGQSGDMEMVRGNKAVRDHSIDGKELHLFRTLGGGNLTYIGQFDCAEYEVIDGVPDRDGALREAIVFMLVPAHGDEAPPTFDPELGSGRSRWDIPMEELRALAAERATRAGHAPSAKRKLYHRSQALKVYVKRRAEGNCEGCGDPAPFDSRADGMPYLEPHHTTRLADGGPDHPAHVIALCPTCHRRAHHAPDGDSYNEQLKLRLVEIEESHTAGPTPLQVDSRLTNTKKVGG